MKHNKINYRQKSIAEIMKSKAMTETQATSYYNRLYNTALKSVDRSVRTNVNVARELYASTLAPYAEEYRKKGYNIFELDNAKNKVELKTFSDKQNLGEFLISRLKLQ